MNNEFENQQEAQWTYQEAPNQYVPEPPKQYIPGPPKKNDGAGKIIALALCVSLVAGALSSAGIFFGLKYIFPQAAATAPADKNATIIQEGNREDTVIDITEIDTSKVMTPAEVYAANVNSTVGITTSVNTNYWGYQTTAAAAGSGFILSSDGYILTNYHVIENSSAITVALFDGTNYDASVVGYDASNDIAILKVNAKDLTPVTIGDSGNMNVGDEVVAIGNPLGELTFSLTRGVVSALDRQVTLSSGSTMNLIQTDCSINSGNSGGALFNLYGEVIGITNAKYSNNGNSSEATIENIGFAIPINDIRSIVESIIEKGYIAKPYIGVSVIDVSEETQSYGLPQGASVKEVVPDGPAEKAGLKPNDIITKVNDTKITSSSDLVSYVRDMKVNDVLKLKVYRQGEYLTIEVTVGEQIQSATAQEDGQTQSTPSMPYRGNGN